VRNIGIIGAVKLSWGWATKDSMMSKADVRALVIQPLCEIPWKIPRRGSSPFF
jgi:hypothetical protein